MSDVFSEKELKIISLFKPLIAAESDKKYAEGHLIGAVLAATEYSREDEVIEILENNKGKSLDEIVHLIYDSDLFPPVEIVDDDDLDGEAD